MNDNVKDYPPYLDYPKPRKTITNADRIRSMTDEELARFLDNTDGDFPPNVERCSIEESEEYWLDWLKQEAE